MSGDEFHDVVFNSEKILRGEIVHEGQQIITARITVKIDIQGVDDLLEILNEYKQGYKEGAGLLLYTHIGKFSR